MKFKYQATLLKNGDFYDAELFETMEDAERWCRSCNRLIKRYSHFATVIKRSN